MIKIEKAIAELKKVSAECCYPRVLFDFDQQSEILFPSFRIFEDKLRSQLTSSSNAQVKNGLSNVLYWGLYRMGIRDVRVKHFRENISDRQLAQARALFRNMSGKGLRDIAELQLPQFSMMPFVSKIRMFLDPKSFVVLDNKLAKLRGRSTFFERLKKTRADTSIRLTEQNLLFYEDWCGLCVAAARMMGSKNQIAVDAERAIFELVDRGEIERAAVIVDTVQRALNNKGVGKS